MSNENFAPVKLAGKHLDKRSRYPKSEIVNSVHHDFPDRHHSKFSNSGVTFLETDGSASATFPISLSCYSSFLVNSC